MEKNHIQQTSLLQRITLYIISVIVRVWARTIRVKVTDTSMDAMNHDKPGIFILWHNRLIAAHEVHRRFFAKKRNRKIFGIVSASKDGALLTTLFKYLGVGSIRGSSSWRGAQAVSEALKQLKNGNDIGITPDGPRGPCYSVKEGVVVLARKTNAPIYLFSGKYKHAIRLGSWDGFYLPFPFTKSELHCRVFENIDELEKASQYTGAEAIRELMMEITKD